MVLKTESGVLQLMRLVVSLSRLPACWAQSKTSKNHFIGTKQGEMVVTRIKTSSLERTRNLPCQSSGQEKMYVN